MTTKKMLALAALVLALTVTVLAGSGSATSMFADTFAGGVSGSMTRNQIPKVNGPSMIADSNLNDDGTTVTLASAKTLAVTTADKLTVGSVIVPQNLELNWTAISASNVSGDFVFQANRAYQVTAVRVVQRAQGGSGCVIDVEKITGTTAPGSGTVIGTGSYNCNSTANNTVTTYALTATTANLQLAAGDRLGVKLGGTLTSLAGATVSVQLKAI